MKILIASTPATGHLNPLLTIGRILIAEGHEVVGLSGSALREPIEGIGAEFRPLPAGADFDLRDLLSVVPELKNIPPGPQWLRVAIERVFVDTIPAQHRGLQQVLRDFPVDVIIGDNMILGVLPMLLGPCSKRPPVVLCGTSILHWRREDGAPPFAGLPPATTQAQLEEYAAISQEHDRVVNQPLARRLKDLGVGPLSMTVFDAVVELADAYMQLTVPSFEFPRDIPTSVHFIGALPIVPKQAPLPAWAYELDGSRKVVLVTQGTLANHNFGLLIAPTLAALADEPDLLVIVTAGGRPIDTIPGPIPGNARLASYLPFEWMLPKVDVFVTNGGYGSVNQAMSFGIPLVTAGLTEDKADVNARVAWSGVGIDLATNEPTPQALREAIRTVLDKPNYRLRASLMAEEFDAIDTRSQILRIVSQVLHRSDEDGLWRGEVEKNKTHLNVNHLVPEPSERLVTEGETSDMKSQIAQQHPSGGRQMQAAAIRMTPHQIALVRESFATVVPISEQAVGLFYDRLFAIDPSTRPLFQGDMKSQGVKLMAAIGAVVKSLDCIETILGDLRALARRHDRYGVREEHYASVGAALLWTLEELGLDFTPDVREAWTTAYGLLSGAMIAASSEPLRGAA